MLCSFAHVAKTFASTTTPHQEIRVVDGLPAAHGFRLLQQRAPAGVAPQRCPLHPAVLAPFSHSGGKCFSTSASFRGKERKDSFALRLQADSQRSGNEPRANLGLDEEGESGAKSGGVSGGAALAAPPKAAKKLGWVMGVLVRVWASRPGGDDDTRAEI